VRYLLLIGGQDDGSGRSSNDICGEDAVRAWVEEMTRRGVFVSGEVLAPEATTVRVRAGDVLLADGPFAETKEQVGGFSLVECADLDEAVEVAASHPVARFGTIEVRPVWPS
jgi:hypothetical protein